MPDLQVDSSDVAEFHLRNVGGTASWIAPRHVSDEPPPFVGLLEGDTALRFSALISVGSQAVAITAHGYPFHSPENHSLTEPRDRREVGLPSRMMTLSKTIRPMVPPFQIAGSAADLVGHIDLEAVSAFVDAISELDPLPAPVRAEGFVSVENPDWRQLVFAFPRKLDADERATARKLFASAMNTAIERKPDLADAIADTISLRV